ncbi:MAG: nitrate reductase [Pseudanabaenaceae cyanobacterium SKYGB_i_bin29]|nr:nitrate reductase [Pseudanabaenaceae cyanobacterium SKYG29]MDW8421855.1 nitrate reductase [Pseudanabaenaceae cyanobacterium SKYGB_i_bin29]
METITKTLCPYCGVGCGLEVVAGNKVRGDRDHLSSLGMVCVKGATVLEALDKDRLLYPLYRPSLDQPFRRISWEEAFDLIVTRIKHVLATTGADSICLYGSGQWQTEDYYVAQKLIKGCLGTNNFDTNSRLCMSSAVAAYMASFGSDGPTACYADLEITDCAFLIGTNTAECHPIVFNRLRQHHKKNPHVKLIVVDPRRTETAAVANLHLAIRPGTDIYLLHGIGHLLIEWGSIKREFIDRYTTGFPLYQEVVKKYHPQLVADYCGIAVGDLVQAAQWWAESSAVLSMWSMGINQSREGTAKARSLINLHLLTGQIGKPGAGPFSLTGQPNAMGGRETGGLSHLLPGYRQVTNPNHRREVENHWQLPPGSISSQVGRTAWQIIEGLEWGEVQLLWIAATNPLVSLPHLDRVKAALTRSPFTIYQDCYYPTETSDYAHLVLPCAQWGEKTGTMTNSERRVTLCQAFRAPVGEAKPDWEIFAEVGRRLGFTKQFAFQSSAEVYAEFVQLTSGRTCDVAGISHDRLRRLGAIQWPCPEGCSDAEAVGEKRLYTDYRFLTEDGRAHFCVEDALGVAEPPDHDYPFILTTGRLYGHWHTQTRTGRIAKINKMHPHPFVEINNTDAEALGIKEGTIVRLESRRGFAQLPAKVTPHIARGTVFMPMHWGALWHPSAEVNNLTHPVACPAAKQPELKACAVRLVIDVGGSQT